MLKLFSKNASRDQNDQLAFRIAIELSFEASFQVSYRDESNNLKIKRLRASSWSVDLLNPIDQATTIEFKVFVYSPNLSKDENLKMMLFENGELRSEKSFSIPAENEHAGWFSLQYRAEQ